jgi:hypothetical protein
MPLASLHLSRLVIIAGWLVWGPATFAQENSAWVDPPSGPDNTLTAKAEVPSNSTQLPMLTAWASSQDYKRARAARDFAFSYLDFWSAPNRVTLASASSFYGSTVRFHGAMRTRGSVLAEKRRFAQRWPGRTYRYRPETTQVACEAGGAQCTVRSIFDFAVAHSGQGRRSRGIGDHELVVSFSSGRPVIASENSRVLRRGLTRFGAAESRGLTR